MDVVNYALVFLLLHKCKFRSYPDRYYEYSAKISRDISKHAGNLTTGNIKMQVRSIDDQQNNQTLFLLIPRCTYIEYYFSHKSKINEYR